MPKFTWSRYSQFGYEVSTRGDSRFSAFNARLLDGRSVETHYQCDIKGYQPGGTNWRLGKGKPPLTPHTPDQLFSSYLHLWRLWAHDHPDLMAELYTKAVEHNETLTDMFASTPINQAHALSHLLNEMEHPNVTN